MPDIRRVSRKIIFLTIRGANSNKYNGKVLVQQSNPKKSLITLEINGKTVENPHPSPAQTIKQQPFMTSNVRNRNTAGEKIRVDLVSSSAKIAKNTFSECCMRWGRCEWWYFVENRGNSGVSRRFETLCEPSGRPSQCAPSLVSRLVVSGVCVVLLYIFLDSHVD